jgi:hypothetical protein
MTVTDISKNEERLLCEEKDPHIIILKRKRIKQDDVNTSTLN